MTLVKTIKLVFALKHLLDKLSIYLMTRANAKDLEKLGDAIEKAKAARTKEESQEAVKALEEAMRG